MRVELPIVVLGPDGRPAAGATVQVRLRADASDATIYQAAVGGAVYANPLVSDAQGRVTGWVERGAYDCTVDTDGLDPYVESFDATPAGDGGIDEDWLGDGQVRFRHLADDALPARGWAVGDLKHSHQAADHEGWLLADGRNTLVRADFPVDFVDTMLARGFVGVNGVTFGVPDYRGRVVVGRGTHGDVDAYTDSDGVTVDNRRPKHRHSVVDPGHSHRPGDVAKLFATWRAGDAADWPGGAGSPYPEFTSGSTENKVTGISVGTKTGAAVDANAPLDGPAYGVANVFVFTGLMPDGSVPPATATGLQARRAAQIVTPATAQNAHAIGAVALPSGSQIIRVAADKASRVRLYMTAADRDAAGEAARAFGADPVGDHGLVLDVQDGAAALAIRPSGALGYNFDNPVVDQLYYRVTQLAAAGGVITVDLTYVQLEA